MSGIRPSAGSWVTNLSAHDQDRPVAPAPGIARRQRINNGPECSLAWPNTLPLTASTMRGPSLGAIIVTLLMAAAPAAAHQVPFSYLDARVDADGVDVTLVVHIVDVAHELGIDPPERFLDAAFLASRADAITSLLEPRLRLTADGRALENPTWSGLEPLAERQSVRMHARYNSGRRTGMLAIDARMFPYDPPHQTFVNFYDADELRF